MLKKKFLVFVLTHSLFLAAGFCFRPASDYVKASNMVGDLQQESFGDEDNYEIVVIVATKSNHLNYCDKDADWGKRIVKGKVKVSGGELYYKTTGNMFGHYGHVFRFVPKDK